MRATVRQRRADTARASVSGDLEPEPLAVAPQQADGLSYPAAHRPVFQVIGARQVDLAPHLDVQDLARDQRQDFRQIFVEGF